MNYRIEKYTSTMQKEWDEFVLKKSINGTFLQTRRFIEYHPKDRFMDYSLIAYKGNAIIACILACELKEAEEKVFFSHKGTSYGGIIVSPNIYNASSISVLMDLFEEYLKNEGFKKVYLKMTPSILSRENVDLLDYFLYQRGYTQYNELNYYMRLKRYKEDILSQFSSSKRRDYRYSLKNDLIFKELTMPESIKGFYEVLQLNLKKLGLNSVHTYEELLDLKLKRFNENIEFYGVYQGQQMIAGSMVFLFDDKIMHTQYLSSDEKYLTYFPMDFLIYNLISLAVDRGLEIFTFGICTEDQGRYLNLGLSRFKEGFGTEYCLNKSFEKTLML
ncbi:MAG: peptidoglycan bridge formation glycyltransferase FemA/FemB family protein [Lachnospiraceae bacterium]|nr:peptidoglycan bridge formation glycyltransferase FemA/FemB family protein [Lachnospiraceae bacterium]